MRNVPILFVLILFLSACANLDFINTASLPTATISVTSTDPPTSTPSPTMAPSLTVTFTATQIPNGFELYFEIWLMIKTGDLECAEFLWEDVGLEVKTGSVQPFTIRNEDTPPDSAILCSGYFVMPPEPGLGYFVYKDLEKGIQVLPATYTENDITQIVSDSNRNTTPGPAQ